MKRNAKTFFAAAAVVLLAFALTFTACEEESGDGPGGASDTRVELAAGSAVGVEFDATSASVTFTGASGLTLAAGDFTVTGGVSITSVSVAGNTVTVTVGLSTNSTDEVKTYTVGINASSTKIKGSAQVTISQESEHPTVVPGANLEAKFTWLKTNAKSFTDYTMEVSANQELTRKTLHADELNGKSNISITLIGITSERIVQLSGSSPLFEITNGYTLIIDDKINLKGGSGGAFNVVKAGGKLEMKDGARITGFSSSAVFGGAVNVEGGTFTMNGGEISENTAGSRGAGVFVESGTFTMNGGTITKNTADSFTGAPGAGVYVYGGNFVMNDGAITENTANGGGAGVFAGGTSFTMNGGTISKNISSNWGGGVSVGGGTFTMNGGVISGNSAVIGGGVYFAWYTTINKPASVTGGIIYGNDAGEDSNTVTGGAKAGAALSGYTTYGNGYINETVGASTALTVVNGTGDTGPWIID